MCTQYSTCVLNGVIVQQNHCVPFCGHQTVVVTKDFLDLGGNHLTINELYLFIFNYAE